MSTSRFRLALAFAVGAPLSSAGCSRQLTGTSLVVGPGGLPVIGYGLMASDTNANPPLTLEQLKIAHCEDADCTRATLTLLDPDAATGPSLAFGRDGLALISYARGRDELRVAHCEDAACVQVRRSVLGHPFALSTSLAIGDDGRGLISYRGWANGELGVAHCDDDACTRATITEIEKGSGPQHRSLAMVIGADGLGLIAYPDGGSGRLRVAHCENAACTVASVRTIDDTNRWNDPSIAIGRDGVAVIAYTASGTGELKVARCADVSCTGADSSTIDPGGNTRFAGSTSVAIGSDGLPLISYSAATFAELRVAHCSDPGCTRADVVTTLDQTPGIGSTSLAIGRDGRASISYASGALLRIARCADVPCTRAVLTTLDSVPTTIP